MIIMVAKNMTNKLLVFTLHLCYEVKQNLLRADFRRGNLCDRRLAKSGQFSEYFSLIVTPLLRLSQES